MPGNALLDYADTLAYFTWKLLSAIAIVIGVRILQDFVEDSYTACNDQDKRRKEESMDYKMLIVRVKAIGGLLTCIVVIGVSGFVLDAEWVRQIVSAGFVGVGFALRGFIDDMLWGFVRRSDHRIRKPILIELPVIIDNKPVKRYEKGTIEEMSLTTFKFLRSEESNDTKLYVLTWSSLRHYQYDP